MLSDAQIALGTARLTAGQLRPGDVDAMVANFRLLVGGLEDVYSYAFEADLTALTDARGKASKIAAILLLLIDDGFSVLKLTGKNNVALSDEDQRRLTILYAFNLLYKTPPELTDLMIVNLSGTQAFSGSIPSVRVW